MKLSELQKAKISKTVKENWRNLSVESRSRLCQAISEGTKRGMQRPGVKTKLQKQGKLNWENPNYRKTVSEKVAAKTRERWKNPEFYAKHVEQIRSLNYDPNIVERRAKKIKERWADPEYHKRVAMKLRKLGQTPEFRAKMSQINAKRWQDPVWAKRQREATKLRWQDSIWVQKTMQARKVKPTKLEEEFNALLQQYFPNQWEYVGNGQLIVGYKNPDFWDGEHKLIEIYGDYWHKGDNPQKRINHFRKYGYECLVIWQYELEDTGIVKDKIFQFVSNT